MSKKIPLTIPKMTSNTTPAPYVVSFSSQNPTFQAWKAFSGEYWYSGVVISPTVPQWIAMDFGGLKEVEYVGFNATTVPTQFVTSCTVSASKDGLSFIELTTENYTGSQVQENYEVKIPKDYYKAIKLAINSITGGARQAIIGRISYGIYENVSMALKNSTTNQHYSLVNNTLIHLPDASDKNMILHGIEQGKEIQLDVPFDKIKTVVDNGDGTQTVTEEDVEPFSVYDYISETPEVLVYTESTDDIVISTTTEPFDLYDEFGDEVEVLYYTDDEAVNEADLVLEANWSPIDELEGDFEVVTWTDEDTDTAQRTLEMTATPTPKFVYSSNTVETYDELLDIISEDMSTYYNKSKVRYLITPNNLEWYTYQNGNFIAVSDLGDTSILEHGITFDILKNMTEEDFSKWNFDTVNVGVYLEDGIRNDIISSITPVQAFMNVPKYTPQVEDASFYILNTTAQINLDFNGLTLSGVLSDADMTRVQYRVSLNGIPYYPADGSFTPLSAPPENILITLDSDDVIINDWNDLEVEFQDFFGTTDTWSIRFIGKYAGIMFMDESGEYYSTDMGRVLQYLDFGEVLTGQVTPSYPVKIKNEYGFPIKDTKIMVNNSSFAEGLKVEFQLSEGVRDFEEELLLGRFANNEEKTFYINMRSPITTIPNDNDKFDIYVVATRDV